MTLPVEFTDFLKTCSDLDLVSMQSEARKVHDKDTLQAVLVELGNRTKERAQKKMRTPCPGCGGVGGYHVIGCRSVNQ